MKNDNYILNYNEAVDVLMNKKGFIQGENFRKGLYVGLDNMGIAYLYNADNMCQKEEKFMLCTSTYDQKYRVIISANESRYK